MTVECFGSALVLQFDMYDAVGFEVRTVTLSWRPYCQHDDSKQNTSGSVYGSGDACSGN